MIKGAGFGGEICGHCMVEKTESELTRFPPKDLENSGQPPYQKNDPLFFEYATFDKLTNS